MSGLRECIGEVPPVHDAARAEQALGELDEQARAAEALLPLADMMAEDAKAQALVRAVFGASPFLTSLILREPGMLLRCLAQDPDAHLASLGEALGHSLAAAGSEADVMRLLRRYKSEVALLVALADIGGVWPVERVTAGLSDAADRVVAEALRFVLGRAAENGVYRPADAARPEADSGYFVLGMGKLGAHELNYSSDIDLIVFYDPDRARLADGKEHGPFFVRLTRDLVRLLHERTADGYVFRTDLRLRPDPGATQVALSVEAGLTYYEAFGQNWERAALIKARVIAGDREAGEAFLAQLAPFVWRKYLDFAAVADIHAMKRRVHRFKGHGEIAVAGHNVKLGRGGIREIEFFVQTQQLIAGGRQQELRERSTLVTLRQLADNGWITGDVADDLAEAYRFLRHVEHRLQMIADEQTHSLPENGEGLGRVARFCGFADAAAFAEALIARLTKVQSHYDRLFESVPAPAQGAWHLVFRGDDEDPATLAALNEMGFKDATAVFTAVRAWQSGRYSATRSERARERLLEFLPHLLEALGATAQPDLALATFDRFLAELPAGVQLFSLLRSKPGMLRLIADIMGTAPRLARVLSRQARVVDAVLDPGFFGDLPSPEDLEGLIAGEVAAGTDFQDCLDRARVTGREQAFLIGVRVLSGTITADQAGGAYARLADNLIRALQLAVEDETERLHGRMPDGRAAVLAMGKLGGREMTAASDLDLIVVYDFAAEATMSDGPKALAGGQYYARFTQRLISALSAPTAEGTIYEVDMRLRPSGHSGPVATRLESFVDYQHNKAWTWEHLALTRARVISGPETLRRDIEETIRHVLSQSRERAKVAEDVREMRAKIEKEKGTDDIWDLKQARGGLVDLEFVTQFLQIVSAHAHPHVLDQNTAAGLEKLAQASVLQAPDAEILIPAARLYNNLTQVLRLCLDRPFDPADAPAGLKALLARAAGLPDFPTLEAHLRETLGQVHAASERIVV